MGSIVSNLSANELLEEALYHIGEPYFNQLTQDIEILVDVINHEQTQRFIREKLVRNHEELIEQCRDIEDAKTLYDLLRGLKILIDGLSWTSSMAIEQGYEFLFAGLCEDLAFLRYSDVSMEKRAKQFSDYLEFSILNPNSKICRDFDITEFIETREENMKRLYCTSNEEEESKDKERERVIRALEAESEEIREEHCQAMANSNMEKNSLVSELKTLLEPFWREMVSLESVSKTFQNDEEKGNKCKKVVEKVRPYSLNWEQEWLTCSLDKINKKLIDYFHEDRTTESDDMMRHFLNESNLNIYLTKFIGCIKPWLVSIRSKLGNLPQKSLYLRKELIMKEVNRLIKFYYARMLNKPELLRDHEKILTELMHQAANEPRIKTNAPYSNWMSVMPLISFEQFSWNPNTNTHNICMMFVLNSSNTFMENHSIATELEKMFEVPLQFMDKNGVKVFQMIKTVDGNVQKYVYRRIHELADLQIPAAFISDYEMEVQRAMNPHYFRIYSIRGVDQADGFISTYFSEFQDRGGEPYYCPNGWRRFSVDVGEMSDAMYEDWPVAYHGTKKKYAQQILMSSIKSSGNCKNLLKGGVIFLSPSIEYSGHPRYAGIWKTNRWWKENKYIQLVLQVRVKKSRIFDKIGGTVYGAESFDPPCDPNFVHNCEMEWRIKWPSGNVMNAKDGLLVYGVMLRVTDVHPSKLPQNQWWAKKYSTYLDE